MKVILLKGVPKIGKPEDVVEVNEGFARNALFPKKLAVPATDAALSELTRKQSARAADKAVRRSLLNKAIEEAASKSLVYRANANEQGNLFSKIDSRLVADYLMSEHRLSIDHSCIELPGGVIKKVGEYHITIKDGSYERQVPFTVLKK